MPSRADIDKSQEKQWGEIALTTAQALLAFAIVGLAITVALVILFDESPSTVAIQSSDSPANFDAVSAVAYGERMADLASLTIVTGLTIGGAILGLNWYTARRNYQDEKERIKEQEDRLFETVSRDRENLESEINNINNHLDKIQVVHNGLSESVSALEQKVDNDRSAFAESIASTIETMYMTGATSLISPSSVRVGGELGMLSRTLRALDSIGPLASKSEVADRIVARFIDRNKSLFAGDQMIGISQFEQFVLDQTSAQVWTLVSKEILSEWNEWEKHFRFQEEPLSQSKG